MKKLIFTLVITTFFSYAAMAQTGNNQVSGGLEIALPVGDFSDGYNLGLGLTLKGLYGIGEAGQITFTTGFIRFGLKESEADFKGSLAVIPLLAGYRHHFEGGFYAEPQLGLSVNRVKFESDFGGFGSFNGTASDTSLSYAATVGYLKNNFDVSLRYQGLSSSGSGLGFIGLRIGYNYSL